MLADIKLLLNIPLSDTSNDALLNSLYRIMQQKVKNYCNIATIPGELDFTVSEMTVGLFKANYGAQTIISIGTGQEVPTGVIKSESLGDYSVTYDTGSSTSASISSVTGELLNDYSAQLNLFRKLRL